MSSETIYTDTKFTTENDPYDKVTCLICGKQFTESHTLKIHGIKIKEYQEIFNDVPIISQEISKKLSDKVKGDKNPAYQHGGRLSPFSTKFKKYDHLTEDEKELKINEMFENNSKHFAEYPEKLSTKIEYYLAQGMSEDEAREALSKRQTTFSLEICIEKYGLIQGVKRWKERQRKWCKNFKKNNFSKVSQTLFWMIAENLESLDGIYFAQLSKDKDLDDSGVNNELRVTLDDKTFLLDFVDVNQKKVIEFDGTYWHQVHSERDKVKNELLEKNGYKFYRVSESDFRNDPSSILNYCLDFLKLA